MLFKIYWSKLANIKEAYQKCLHRITGKFSKPKLASFYQLQNMFGFPQRFWGLQDLEDTVTVEFCPLKSSQNTKKTNKRNPKYLGEPKKGLGSWI